MYVNVSTRVPGLCLSPRPLRLSNKNKAARPRAVYNAPVQRVRARGVRDGAVEMFVESEGLGKWYRRRVFCYAPGEKHESRNF